MAKFINFGVLWKPKPGARTAASGTIDLDKVKELLDVWPRGESRMRIFVKKNDGGSARGPDYQLTAVYDEDEAPRNSDREDGHDQRREPEHQRAREPEHRRAREPEHQREREPERQSEREREPFRATDDDVPF